MLTLLTVPVNSFTVLEYDVPAPSIPPLSDFSFAYPPPSSSAVVHAVSDAGTSSLLRPSTTPNLSTIVFPIERSESCEHDQSGTAINNSAVGSPKVLRAWSPALPSIANSPPFLPRVQLPESLPSKINHLAPNLDDVRIPSPLLYHKNARRTLSDHCIVDELDDAFNLTRSTSPDLTGRDQMHVATDFRNVPQPPWVLPSREDSPEPTPATRGMLTHKLGQDTSTIADNAPELVYPVVNTTPVTPSTPAEPGSEVLKHNPEPDFIEDDPKKIERMWDAFEAAVAQPQELPRSSSWAFMAQSSSTSRQASSSAETVRSAVPTVDIAGCPTPSCTALVSARLYHHQYLSWPQWRVQDYRDTAFPFIGAYSLGPSNESLLTRWYQDCGFDSRHLPECQHTEGGLSAVGIGAGEIVSTDADSPISDDVTSEGIDDASTATEPELDHDSAYESASEIFADDAALSDDEWADFDWDDDTIWKYEVADTGKNADEAAWEEVHQRLA